jgi:cyclopropane-fatty-acyl-phospholipid synthase
MNTRLASAGSSEFREAPAKPSVLDTLARRIVLSRLENLRSGQIIVSENGEQTTFGEITADFPLPAKLSVLNLRFYREIAFGGSIGAGEAYIDGYWTCTDPTDLLRILIRNRDVLEQMDSGLARLSSPLQKLLHALNRNTRKGTRDWRD